MQWRPRTAMEAEIVASVWLQAPRIVTTRKPQARDLGFLGSGGGI